MNKRLDLTKLASKFQERTGCSDTQAERAVNKYWFECARQLLKHYDIDDNDSRYNFSLKQARDRLNRLEVKGKRYWIWNEFQQIPERIIVELEIGTNFTGRLSKVAINYDYEDILIAGGNSEELVAYLYKDYEQELQLDQVDYVKIDLKSLSAYIKNAKHKQQHSSNLQLTASLKNYQRQATKILMIAEANDGFLPQIRNQSSFGRLYYKGPNLQSVTKEVRHAALGRCWEYDIENSVFAWKLGMFPQAHKDFPITADYIQFKQARRRQLTLEVFGRQDKYYQTIIKTAITSVGFGARITNKGGFWDGNRWHNNSISDIIKSEKYIAKFAHHPWVRDFMQEQQRMDKLIVKELRDLIPNQTEFKDRAGRFKTNTSISYLYQQTEHRIITGIIQAFQPYTPLLLVHDCVYTQQPAGSQTILEVKQQLKELSEFFDISTQEHRGWWWDEDMLEHKQRINQEEQRAQELYGTTVKHKQVDLDLVPRQEQIKDYYDGSGYTEVRYMPEDDELVDDKEYEQMLSEQAGYKLW